MMALSNTVRSIVACWRSQVAKVRHVVGIAKPFAQLDVPILPGAPDALKEVDHSCPKLSKLFSIQSESHDEFGAFGRPSLNSPFFANHEQGGVRNMARIGRRLIGFR